METQRVHLLQGRFEAAEARRLLADLFDSKLRYHARRIREHAGSEEDIKSSETRIKQLEEELRQMLHFLRGVEAEGGRIDLEGTIVVTKV